jgi:hypothetical protein
MCTCLGHEAVSHVGTIVHAQTHSYHKIDTGDYIYSQAPEVDKPTYIHL